LIVIDSSVWIDFFVDREGAEVGQLYALLGQGRILIGDLILTEVLQGFRHQQHFAQARSLLLGLPLVQIGGLEIALKSAENYRALRARGVTVRKTIDALIATYCIENGHALLASDRDFEPFFAHLGLERA
jgi:predicted nucleic acid-binding protein